MQCGQAGSGAPRLAVTASRSSVGHFSAQLSELRGQQQLFPSHAVAGAVDGRHGCEQPQNADAQGCGRSGIRLQRVKRA
jgi:hypothetical protein